MILNLTADCAPWRNGPGEVVVKLNGREVRRIYADRIPGAGPGSQEELVVETLVKFLRRIP